MIHLANAAVFLLGLWSHRKPLRKKMWWNSKLLIATDQNKFILSRSVHDRALKEQARRDSEHRGSAD